MANTTRESKTILTAEDRTGGAFASMQKNVQGAQNEIARMHGAIAGLAAVVTTGAFAMMIKATIDAQARMKDLAQEAGVTASAISKFEGPARMAGLGLDTVASAMFKLSKAALEAKDPASRAAQALNAIGVSTAQLKGMKPDEMFELIARSMGKYGDGLEKNAVMQELFGKSGREMNRVMAEVAAGSKLVATVTDEQAEAADLLGDQMIELQMNSEKLWRSLVATAVPAINDVVKAFIDARREGSLLDGMFAAMEKTFDAMKGPPTEQLAAINKTIKLAEESLRDRGSTAYDYNELLRQRIVLEKRVFDQELEAQNRRAMAGLAGGKTAPEFDPAGAAARAAAARKAEADSLREAAKAAAEYAKSIEHLSKWYGILRQDELEAIDARDRLVNGMEDINAQLKLENDTLGMTDAQRSLYLLGLEKERALKGALTEKDVAYINKLAAEREALIGVQAEQRALQAQITTQNSAWDDLANHIVGAFGRGRDAIKDFLRQMLSLFAKKWILQIAAGMTGSASLSAMASTAGQGSAAGSALNLLGMGGAGGIFGSSAAYGAAIGTTSIGAGSQAAMLAAQTGEFGAAGLSATAGSAGGMGSMLAAAGPYIAIAAALYGLYKAFASPGGGPKTGGSFIGNYDATGSLTGTDPTHLFGLKPGESTGNAGVQTLAATTAAAYFQLVKQYGGSASGVTFGLGYDSDPRGTANNRVGATVRDAAGNVIFSERDREIGRDGNNIGPELQLTASRALLAALQSSNLQADMAALFGGVVAATADQATLDTLFAKAADLNYVITALAGTTVPDLTLESIKKFQLATETLGQTFDRIAGEFLAARGALNAAIGARNPQFARDLALSQRNEIAQAFANALGQNFGDELLARMALNPETFTGLNTETMNLLANFLGLQTTLEGLDRDLGTLGGTVQDLGNYVLNAGEIIGQGSGYIPPDATGGARAGLADYLRGSPTGDLSPLTLAQKYDYSKAELNRLLGLANGGDIDAISGLGSARDSFLGFSRQRFGSSGRGTNDFFTTFDQLNTLTGNAAARPPSAGDMKEQTAALVASNEKVVASNADTRAAVVALGNMLAEHGLEVTAPSLLAKLDEIKTGNTAQSTGGVLA